MRQLDTSLITMGAGAGLLCSSALLEFWSLLERSSDFKIAFSVLECLAWAASSQTCRLLSASVSMGNIAERGASAVRTLTEPWTEEREPARPGTVAAGATPPTEWRASAIHADADDRFTLLTRYKATRVCDRRNANQLRAIIYLRSIALVRKRGDIDSLHPIFQFATSGNLVRKLLSFWDVGAIRRVGLTLAPAISELKLMSVRSAFNPNFRLRDVGGGRSLLDPTDRCWKTRGLTNLEEAHAVLHCEFPIVKLSLRVMPCQYYFPQEAKVEQYDVATQSVVAVLVPWGEWNSQSAKSIRSMAITPLKPIAFDVSSTAVGDILAIKVSVRHGYDQRFPSGLNFIEAEGVPCARRNRRYILAENVRAVAIEKARKAYIPAYSSRVGVSRDTDTVDFLRRGSHDPTIVGASRPHASSF